MHLNPWDRTPDEWAAQLRDADAGRRMDAAAALGRLGRKARPALPHLIDALRDGVTHPPDDVSTFEFLPGVIDATARLATAGFQLVVVTNQPDVARGKQTRARVEAMNDLVRRALPILDVLTCYHDNADDCLC